MKRVKLTPQQQREALEMMRARHARRRQKAVEPALPLEQVVRNWGTLSKKAEK